MQITGAEVFLFTFGLLVAVAWIPVAWSVMGLLLPKAVLERFFREPHFNKGELVIYGSFPGNILFRTSIFMAACFQERYRRGRQLSGYLEMVPSWYVRASKALAALFFVHASLILILLVGMGVALYLDP